MLSKEIGEQARNMMATLDAQIEDMIARHGDNIKALEEMQKSLDKCCDELEVTALSFDDAKYEEDHVTSYLNRGA